jgi:hypothetical protein
MSVENAERNTKMTKTEKVLWTVAGIFGFLAVCSWAFTVYAYIMAIMAMMR